MARLPDLSRRLFLQLAAAGSVSGWFSHFATAAAQDPQRRKSVILLWMNGGPATIDLFDLKPGAATGGPFREIQTAAPSVRISEHLPGIARWMRESVIVRSMSTREGDHGRASHYVKTGYVPQGAIQFPPLGALVSHQLWDRTATLPGFVSIAPSNRVRELGAGFLGPQFAPLPIGEGAGSADGLTVPNIQRPADVSADAQGDRLELLRSLEQRFSNQHASTVVEALQASTDRAVAMMQPDAAAAFHLDQESARTRDAYGRSLFGQSCLLARRLVERGVPFVEVTLDGWDTHQNNFDRVRGLSGELDTAWSAMFQDLHDRGLLRDTLIVWMGEFGRTPRINGSNGRDHWPATWSAVMAGAGIQGGQAIGRTNADGTAVEGDPTRLPDFLATVCQAIGVDHTRQNLSNVNRPIRVVEAGAQPIRGVVA